MRTYKIQLFHFELAQTFLSGHLSHLILKAQSCKEDILSQLGLNTRDGFHEVVSTCPRSVSSSLMMCVVIAPAVITRLEHQCATFFNNTRSPKAGKY